MRLASLFAVLAMAVFSGCSQPEGVGREPDEFVGCGSDEHWATFGDRPAMVADAQAPQFTAPATSGTSIPAAGKVTLEWSQSPSSPGAPEGDVPFVNGPGCDNCCPQFNTGFTLLHVPAVSGNVYDLSFSIDGAIVHRVITTLQKWAPSDAVWSSWRGKTVSVQIARMALLKNDPKEGPFTPSTPFTFTVSD